MIIALIWVRYSLLNFKIISTIKHQKDGADECDRISKIHKCGVEKDPELIENMSIVGNLEGAVVRNRNLSIFRHNFSQMFPRFRINFLQTQRFANRTPA